MIQKTLFFDIGNVQLFFDHRKMCKAIAHLFGLENNQVFDLLFKEKLLDDWEIGKIHYQYLYNIFASMSKTYPSLSSFLEALSNIFTPNTSLFPIIKALKDENTYLVLISNTGDAHFDFATSHFPILSLFDDRLLSFEMKMRKPNPLIYKLALEKARGPSLYVDDIDEFVQSAKKCGLDSELFTTSEKLQKQLITKGFLNE
jgi:FMN phosphatase YigB (HAD superfamily)